MQGFLSNLRAGDAILFARGGNWTGGLTLPTGLVGSSGKPITFGNYGSGALPIIDGGGSSIACFYARSTGNSSQPLWAYITIDGFECRNETEYGVLFYQNYGGSAGMPGIVVQNMNIHNTGPHGDDGNYRNQLMFLDENDKADGVQFLNNTVDTCGGHNCIQVHYDAGHPVISGNTCYGWTHNCIDVKLSVGAMVSNNVVHGPASSGSAFYFENPSSAKGDITWENNLVYDAPNGFECESSTSTCHVWNNTAYIGNSSAIVTGTCGGISIDVRNNILDTTDPLYESSSCGQITTWDYNDNGGSHGSVSGPSGPHDMDGVNPMYVNSGGNNFHLQSASPLINKGLLGLTTNADIGAY